MEFSPGNCGPTGSFFLRPFIPSPLKLACRPFELISSALSAAGALWDGRNAILPTFTRGGAILRLPIEKLEVVPSPQGIRGGSAIKEPSFILP